MPDQAKVLTETLSTLVRRLIEGASGVRDLRHLSGGASQETWSFEAFGPEDLLPLILRRAPGGSREGRSATAVSLETEAELISLVGEAGVPVPQVRHVLTPEDGLGQGFIMTRIEGETIARRILRDPEYAAIRPKLARQCGEILARIHNVAPAKLPPLRSSPASEEIDRYFDIYRAHDHPHPVFDLAFRWLKEHVPETSTPTLVHGDFRNGNLVIGPDGVRAVLDWELAHIGDPMEDLGWICVNSWRFGNIDLPVGGFGRREDMFAGYEAAGGGAVDSGRIKFWEVLGTLKWGVMCTIMADAFKSGADRSVERATIGRRASETEIDLLRLLVPEGYGR